MTEPGENKAANLPASSPANPPTSQGEAANLVNVSERSVRADFRQLGREHAALIFAGVLKFNARGERVDMRETLIGKSRDLVEHGASQAELEIWIEALLEALTTLLDNSTAGLVAATVVIRAGLDEALAGAKPMGTG